MVFNMKNSNIKDMTVGSPSIHILSFAVPLLIGNVFQQLYNMVDSIVVGNFVGANAIAAVGTCGSMNFLFFSLSSGLAIGIGIIVAQYFGAKEERLVKTTIANSFYVLGVVSIIISIVGCLICPFILKLLRCPDVIFPDSVVYMRTTCYGIIFVAIYNGVASILRALGDSKTPLYFLILSSIVNLVLDLVFVLSCGWGVFGVAFATIISQAVSAITSLIYAYYKNPYFHLSKRELQPHRMIILNSFKLGVPIALQNALIAVSMMVLQGVVNTFGETVMASYTISMRIEQLVQQPYGSLGAAVTTYSGQNCGAKDFDRVKKGMHRGTLFAFIFSLAMLPLFQFFSPMIVSWFVKDSEVIRIGAAGLRITSIAYFGLGMIYVPRAVLNGCGDANFALINGISEVVCRILFSQILSRIAVISLFGHEIAMGYRGIWYTTALTWILTGVVCLIRYKSGVWKKKALVG